MPTSVKCALYFAATGCLIGQPLVFELQIPELADRVFDADVIEVPGSLPQSLIIRVLNPVAAEVDYGKILTKLNGEGAAYITTVSGAMDGKIARMDLKLRTGMQLLPGTNTVEVQATNHHGRKFYRNFLIKTREKERNGYFVYESTSVPGDSTGGPDISIDQPEGPVVLPTRTSSRSVAIKGKISSVNSLARFRVGGKDAARPNKNVFNFDAQVQVSPTDNSIVVEAVDQGGNRAAVTIPVSRISAGRPLTIQGNRYGLVIGISQYSAKPALPSLPSASLDARDFAAALTEQAGFKRENVFVLRDEEATRAQIINALRNFVARPRPDDLLIVFVSAYGLHDPLDPSKLYLAAYDTQHPQVPETAISVDDLKLTLGTSIRSRQTLLLFDVNHPLTGDWATKTNNLINDYLLRLFPGDPGKAVMVASSIGENSMEEEGHGGLFARQLIDAARGAADVNQDGAITVREWFLQVSRAVRVASKGAQNPRFTLQQPEKPVFVMAR